MKKLDINDLLTYHSPTYIGMGWSEETKRYSKPSYKSASIEFNKPLRRLEPEEAKQLGEALIAFAKKGLADNKKENVERRI